MKTLSAAFGYLLVILAGAGLINVPHALVYEHPSTIFARYHRDDLNG
ncbi:hypothetical protein DSS3P8_140 [Roseobacter phage DSS3P8]|nr:hypothetical protein DSS3P8_140 [Roseobacter phage DSS3P8]